MSNRFLRAVLALYPRGFRRRYGPEVQGLVNDLEAAGDRSRLRLVSGLLVSAVAERLRTVRLDARLTIPTLAAVAALGTIVSAAGPAAPPATALAGPMAPPTAGTVGARPDPRLRGRRRSPGPWRHPRRAGRARPDPRLRGRRRSRGPWRHPRRARRTPKAELPLSDRAALSSPIANTLLRARTIGADAWATPLDPPGNSEAGGRRAIDRVRSRRWARASLRSQRRRRASAHGRPR